MWRQLPETFRQVITGKGAGQAGTCSDCVRHIQQKIVIMNLRVIIATHNRTELLARTLTSLAECRRPPGFLGVTVVENGGRFGSEAVCSAADRTLNVQYLYCEQGNKSAALNLVLEQTDDELLVFLDDDVRLERETLCAYAAVAQEETGRVFFGGPVEPDYETAPDPWLHLPYSARGWSLSAETRYVDLPSFLGFNWAAWASDLRELGGFSMLVGPGGTTGARGQESEMQRRMLRDGFLGRYVKEALVWHWVPAERCSEQWSLERAWQNCVGAGLLVCQRGMLHGILRWTASRVLMFTVSVLGGQQPVGYAARLQWMRWLGYVWGRVLRMTQRDVPAEAYGSQPATAVLPQTADMDRQSEVHLKPIAPARQSA